MKQPPAIIPIHLTIGDACRYAAMSRSKAYEEMGKGNLEAVKDGKRTLITFASLKAYAEARKPAVIGKGDEKFQEMRRHSGSNGSKPKAKPKAALDSRPKRRARPRKSEHAGAEA